MAWNGGGGFGDEEEGRGLELSLGLPGYFSAVVDQEGKGGSAAATGAKGNSGDFQKARPAAPAPVVGWPPVRAFRRNLGASVSKPSHAPSSQRRQYVAAGAEIESGVGKKGRFVKVNMDGVPIGRKVDLAAHGSYDRLSAAVDQLFRGLLAAQTSSGEHKVVTGLVNGSGEYTLVYEDDEGDQMLVGDVPWHMFIATAKRLRVLRSSDLNASSLRAWCRTKPAVER